MDLPLNEPRALDLGPIRFGNNGLVAELLPAEEVGERGSHRPEGERIRVTHPDGRDPVVIELRNYEEMYTIPGLYEAVLEQLRYESPKVVAFQLADAVRRQGGMPADLKVLDLAAGSGLSSAALKGCGVQEIVGFDYMEPARRAALREHATIFPRDDFNYLIGDISKQSDREDIDAVVRGRQLNALHCVGAIEHLPEGGLEAVWKLFPRGSYLSFSFHNNLDETVMPIAEDKPFLKFIQQGVRDGHLELLAQDRYDHRLATDGSVFRGALVVAINSKKRE